MGIKGNTVVTINIQGHRLVDCFYKKKKKLLIGALRKGGSNEVEWGLPGAASANVDNLSDTGHGI